MYSIISRSIGIPVALPHFLISNSVFICTHSGTGTDENGWKRFGNLPCNQDWAAFLCSFRYSEGDFPVCFLK
jgi:hypothetical protein